MREKRNFRILEVVCISILLAAWSNGVLAKEEIKAPLLTGDTWIKMSQAQKSAYIWGVGDVIDLEQELMEIYPELKRESFASKAVEGIGDVIMIDIVSTVDGFFKENPDKVNLSVIRVMWDTMIKPNIKTGIAGKPLK
jgi:hypothetical protein